jgi:prepilin-type N-terminal cleavage/methylation domain-containing protein
MRRRLRFHVGPAFTRPDGMTLVELCIVIIIIGVLVTFAVAMFTGARMTGNESAAIAALRVINSAQFAYLNGCGQGHYATSLTVLGTKGAGNSQGYLSEDLASVVNPIRNGYRFALQPGTAAVPSLNDCNGRPTQTTYYATATPVVQGRRGSRSFATNQRGGVYQAFGPVPPDEPFEPPDQPAQ